MGEALFDKASEYLDLCRSTFSVNKAQQAGRLGAELISSAGTVEKAVQVLNTVRMQKLGDHLAGAKRSALKGISSLHQEYLQECAQDGVPSRREKPLVREEAKNHGSVYGYEEELLQKAWKDAAYGAALFVDPEVGEVSQLLDQARVAESPLGRVPKQNPDRTISAEGRPINDMRRQNDAGSKFNHPPAPQPRHHAVARQSLWWKARHPGIPQKCAKRDVPRAFKWHFLRARDVPEFAVKLAGLIILSLAMPFGWVGSPGEFVAWSAAARAHHGSFRPAEPKFNDVVPFESKWLMDDGVVVEPMVGNRAFDSLAVLDETMQLVWGPEGVNVEKMAEEGEPSTTQLLWGLHMNFDTQEVRLPEPKRIKAKYLLGETALQRGCREVPLRLLQELIGCAQYWTVACPALTPHLPTLYHLLKGNLQGNKGSGGKNANSTLVQVEASDLEEENRRWEDFWDALDFIRLQLEAPLQCSFVSVFEKLLPIRERLALPGVTARARITGGDATLDRIGAVDWKAKVFHADRVDHYREGLRNLAREGEETDIISVMELLAFVVLAVHRRVEWTGELVLYVTDNMNVRTWLHKRRPRNRAASLLVRLVQRLESENHFTVHPIYIRTYRNQLADWLSREDLQVVRNQLATEGWTEVATGLQWEEFLRDAERSALVYPTGNDPQGSVARQLTHPADPAPRPLRQVCLRVPWQPLHVEDYPEITSCGIALRLFGIWDSGNQPYAWYTFSQDPSGRERKRLSKVLETHGHRLKKLVIDCPRQMETTHLAQTVGAVFPNVETCQYISSHLGAITARRRTVLFCWRDVPPPPPDLGQFRANPPPSMQMIPLDSGTTSEVQCIPGVLTQEPGIVTTGDLWLPHPFGHVKGPGVPPKCLVHKVTGPACAFVGPTKDIKGPGATLIPSGTGAVRKLSLSEVARAQGLTATQWMELTSDLGQDEALRRVVQEPCWQVPAAILGLWQDEPLKAGNCLDPDEEAARQQLEVWLQAWEQNPERPRDMLDLLHAQAQEGPVHEPTLWPDAGDTRVGGRSAKNPEDRKLVTPVLLGDERDRFFANVGLPGDNLLQSLDQTGQEAVLSKLADSTRRSYGAGWKQWSTFMSGTGVSPFLQGESRAEKQADEEWLIRFVVFLHQHMGRTAQGIKQRLSGIRYAHIAAGYPDPLAGRVRLWAALAGMHRWDGAPVRKVPVTPRMLAWLRAYLQGSNRPAEEKAAVWASIRLGWFYMLRASEYLPGTDALNAPSRVLRGSDLDFFKEGRKCRVSEADSMAVQLRDSKGDQFGRGQVRLQHATGDEICPVRALQEHAKLNPHWLQDSGLPVCAWQGVGVSREGVSEALRLAAVALGYPAHLVASHSLRKGGATAMLAVTSDVETVKRFGGWKSDAVHAYLYTDMAAAPNRAKEMLSSKPVLQPQQHIPAPNRVGHTSSGCEGSLDTRCGGPEDLRPEDEEFGDSDDPDWRSARAKLQDQERRTGLTFIQRLRLKKQIAKGGIVEPPVFLQRFGGVPEWIASASTAHSPQDAESAHRYTAAAVEPPFQTTADESSSPPQPFLPEQVFHSPSRRSALPLVVMADNAPRPAGMGHAQLRDWINQWGSAWAFLGLQPGSSMTDVMKAFKKKALVLHPDKVPESEKADATLRMSALGNAKEILLSPGLRILHDNLLGLGGTAPPHAPGAPPPSSSAAPPQPEPEPSSRPRPSSSSSSKAPPPGPSSSSSWYDRPGPSSSSSSKAPPPDPFAGYDYTWFEKGKGKGPWRQKGRNVWEDPTAPFGRSYVNGPISPRTTALRAMAAGTSTRTHPVHR